MPLLKQILRQPLRQLDKAGLGPSPDQIEQLARQLPQARLSALLEYLRRYAALDDLYFLVDVSGESLSAHVCLRASSSSLAAVSCCVVLCRHEDSGGPP